MAALDPLPMSQKKVDLIKHLDMGLDTYNMMANETDHIYKWLTSDQRHLKSNCKRKPPYDWSDIVENSKDEAMRLIAESGNDYTEYYWKLAAETPECPNWIAKWFLYHKFRYRDGRNRNSIKPENGGHMHSSSSKKPHLHHNHADGAEEATGYDEYYNTYQKCHESVEDEPQGHGYAAPASIGLSNGYGTDYSAQSVHLAYQYAPSTVTTYQEGQYDAPAKGSNGSTYWDPVRDSVVR